MSGHPTAPGEYIALALAAPAVIAFVIWCMRR